ERGHRVDRIQNEVRRGRQFPHELSILNRECGSMIRRRRYTPAAPQPPKEGVMDTHQQTETVDGRLSAAAALQSHQIHAASLTVEECARRIDRHDWIVKHDPVNDVWTVEANNLSAAGVSAFLAEREFLDSLLDENGDLDLSPAA